MKRLALVTSAYYPGAGGGAERHSENFANLLSENYDVTVLTTCAKNYQTWKEEYPEGEEIQDNYKILRFQNEGRSFLFNSYHKNLIKTPESVTEVQFEKWQKLQGPFSEKLISYICNNKNNYDVFLFIGYLYYPVYRGLKEVKHKSVCLLTLHDEPPAYFPSFRKVFTGDSSYCFNTPEEFYLFQKIFQFIPDNYSIVGMSIEDIKIQSNSKTEDYFLYLGRIDEGKGIGELLENFLYWKSKTDFSSRLILAGGGDFKSLWKKYLQNNEYKDSVEYLGFINENEKARILSSSIALILPSRFESFSIACMESWIQERPVIVNSHSLTLKAHLGRSRGGLYYSDREDFSAILDYLIQNQTVASKMGANGRKYVLLNYNKNLIKEKLIRLIEDKIYISSTFPSE
jgi:glycosyltransferase involved in cell wall biosynthesis